MKRSVVVAAFGVAALLLSSAALARHDEVGPRGPPIFKFKFQTAKTSPAPASGHVPTPHLGK